MWLFLAGIVVSFAGGLAALIVSRRASTAHVAGAGSAVLGSIAALAGAALALLGHAPTSVRLEWPVP